MLFNEPKLLKFNTNVFESFSVARSFSALQRAEIAEIGALPSSFTAPLIVSVLFNEPKLLKSPIPTVHKHLSASFSALQRAEIAEILLLLKHTFPQLRFSALQRAEIAEIQREAGWVADKAPVSVLFNEPKLLKFNGTGDLGNASPVFQCSSTSRNC